MQKVVNQDRKWSRDEVIKLLKAQKLRSYINSGMDDRVITTELIELKRSKSENIRNQK